MQDDHPDDVAGPLGERHRDHRLEALLLELGDVVHARVVERVVADQHRLARARDPAADAFVDAEPQPADEVAVDRRGGAQDELLVLDEVDEAGVAVGRLAQDPDDVVEDLLALQRRRDRRDHGVEERVLLADPYVRGELRRHVDYRAILVAAMWPVHTGTGRSVAQGSIVRLVPRGDDPQWRVLGEPRAVGSRPRRWTLVSFVLAQVQSLEDAASAQGATQDSLILGEQFYFFTVVLMWLIHAGFMSYEAGVARRKNLMTTAMKNILTIAVVTPTFYYFGWWIYGCAQPGPADRPELERLRRESSASPASRGATRSGRT